MKGKWKIGEPFGIGVFIHWTFAILIFLLLMGGTGLGFVEGLLVMTAVFGCVVLHELGHSLAARHYGIGTRDITLYPIGGVASLERMPKDPMQELVIAFAGPAVNVVIAAVLFPIGYLLQAVSPALAGFVLTVGIVNVVLVVFNLLPAFPMDGGRVFRALLSMKHDRVYATNLAAKVGKVIAVLLGLYGLFGGGTSMLIFIAIFVWYAGEGERRMVEAEAQPRSFGVDPDLSRIFEQFRNMQSRPMPHGSVPREHPPTTVRDAEWEVLPPERGFRRSM